MKTGVGVGPGVIIGVALGAVGGVGADVVTGGDVVMGVPFGAGVAGATGSFDRESAERVSNLERREVLGVGEDPIVGSGADVACSPTLSPSSPRTTVVSDAVPPQAIMRIAGKATISPLALNPNMPPLNLKS